MNRNRLLLAIFLSIPLVFVLFASSLNLNNLFDEENWYWLTPFIIEAFCFFAIYQQGDLHKTITPKEQKLLLAYALGIFIILNSTVAALWMISNGMAVEPLFLLLTLYALVNVIVTTKRITKHPEHMIKFFKFSYIYPYFVTIIFFTILSFLQFNELNILAFFLILRNFFVIKIP